MSEKEEEKIRKFLESIPDTFDIFEEAIDVQTQMEYIEYSHSFGSGELTENETLRLSSILFSKNTPLEGKKKVLALLAHLGTITAFRQIEKYYKISDKNLKQWTAMALQECRMFLESTLTDQSIGFISSGLGGVLDKLRYYFLILPSSDRAFTPTEKNLIKEEINLVARDLNCVVETVDPSDTFVGFTVLVPMDVALGTFIETGISKCNEFGVIVLEHYYATNLNIPASSEIKEIIAIVKK